MNVVKAWTDYPMITLGDLSGEPAPSFANSMYLVYTNSITERN